MELLFKSLSERRRPEDIAQHILDTFDTDFSAREKSLIQRAAKNSLKKTWHGYTSMAQTFLQPVGAERQAAKVHALFQTGYALTPEQALDPEAVRDLARKVSAEIRKEFGKNDFRSDRLNREERLTAGLDISKRQYNKLWRLLRRVEAKAGKIAREWRKFKFQTVAKSALAREITREEFFKDEKTACFLAYYTARCNLRSEFIFTGQQRPYDEIADMLFKRAMAGPNPNCWAIAHVFPNSDALANLSDRQKGELLGKWFAMLADIGALLKETWEASDFRHETMTVQKGNDSSTWNATAGAWNKARDHWIALLYALGMDDILDAFCPGKVMRLMAADVVFWSIQIGKGLDPNTHVWNELPRPWEVLEGTASCTREMVAEACRKHKLDVAKSGWLAPRPKSVAKFRPSPELVHGVNVGSPFFAKVLKKAGYFSGKGLKFKIEEDAN